MPKAKHPKPWPVKDVHYVEVSLTDLTTRHLHIEFDHGIRIVVANESQLTLATQLIAHLRREANSTGKGGRA
ncbi:hypothetical protein AAFN60_07780 [Roseibacillus persicicus]|uniref:hypothetical protein n=1 Tax=Roseibacillus persicicus TaxID=454148 RepID=UPI00398B6A75